jgi:hypothetical protein
LGGVNRNAGFHAGLFDLPREFFAELLEQRRFHQVPVEPAQDARFKRVTADIEAGQTW